MSCLLRLGWFCLVLLIFVEFDILIELIGFMVVVRAMDCVLLCLVLISFCFGWL